MLLAKRSTEIINGQNANLGRFFETFGAYQGGSRPPAEDLVTATTHLQSYAG